MVQPSWVAPGVFYGSLEDVCAVMVDLDVLDVLAVDVAGDVVAALDDKDRLAARLTVC